MSQSRPVAKVIRDDQERDAWRKLREKPGVVVTSTARVSGRPEK